MRSARAAHVAAILTALATCGAPAWAATDDGPLAAAQRLHLTGRYAEAAEQYGKLREAHPVGAAIGLARANAATGKYDEAVAALEEAAKSEPAAAELPAELAQFAFGRGDYVKARKHVEQALGLDQQQLRARWVQAELYRTSGDLAAAEKAYDWFVSYYDANDEFEDAETLQLIGLGAAQFVRWNRLSDKFSFLVNDLFPDALKLDKEYWPAHYESGMLFLEKYNQAEAAKSLRAALAINPNAADVHAALARLSIQNYELEAAQRSIREALAVNPKHLEAMRMRADLHLANFEPEAAAQVLEQALKLNPVSEATLGRLAASYAMIDGTRSEVAGTRMGRLIDEVTARNKHCGRFYDALAAGLDKGRKYPDAARYFAKAVEVMPQLIGPRGQLGLMYLRLAEETKGRKALEESFRIDPFNVRVSNSIKVLEVLDTYETLETDHFIIRYDGGKDGVLAVYAARHLEKVYPELARRLDFELPEKSLFEIFNRAKNTDGHGWFSARMVGLPQIHTIGACAGKIVAVTSPTSMRKSFNWARVLKHELVHLFNMQQTNFNIPHWFTEALAVLIEDTPRPTEWDEMLARRVPAGKVFNLDSINLGFIRPTSSEDWQMAYCQAEIYAEYMVKHFGEASLGKMLAAYRDNLNTQQAIERALGVSQKELERGYTEHLSQLVASLPASKSSKPRESFAELNRRHEAAPDDMEIAAELALQNLLRGKNAKAGELADRVLEKQPKHQLATYVKAKLLLSIGQRKQAEEMLGACLDRENPRLEVVKLLAGLKFRAKDYEGAEALYRLGASREPGNLAWTKSLAMVFLRSKNRPQLTATLTRLAGADYDNVVVRKKLAQLAIDDDDYAIAAEWANQCLEIDVMDVTAHRTLAEAHGGMEQYAKAAGEYEVALRLAPDRPELRFALAEAWAKAGQREKAVTAVEALLKSNPEHPGAASLLESLKK